MDHRANTQGDGGFSFYSDVSAGGVGFDRSNGSAWTAGLQDPTQNVTGQWYHYAVVQVGSTSLKMYADGTEVDTTATLMDDDSGTYINWFIGGGYNNGGSHSNNYYFDGYLDEIRVSDVARYTGSFTPSTTEFTADSNTLLLIHSNWGGGLGADSSGNFNDFAVTNLVATDQMEDAPSNNFATLNPLDTVNGPAISEGNLKTSAVTGSEQEHVRATIGPATGKWYYEAYITGTGAHQEIALDDYTDAVGTRKWLYQSEGSLYDGSSTVTTSIASYTAGDVLQVAWDMDASKVWFGKNNTWQGASSPNPATATAPNFSNLTSTIIPRLGNYQSSTTWTANFGQDSSFAGALTAQGNQDDNEVGDFYYAPPSGFLAICTSNLPDPEIALPTDHFNTVLYTGTGLAHAITGVGFQPDLNWLKNRTTAGTNNNLTDVVRGVNKQLYSNDDVVEQTDSTIMTAFGADGFTVGTSSDINGSTNNIVSWNWKAGGSGVTNTDGSIGGTVTVSANPTAGFSIGTFTTQATSGAVTIGHGLSQAPTLILLKDLDHTFNWDVYPDSITDAEDYRLVLNENYATDAGGWDDTVPGASTWTFDQSFYGRSGDECVFYAFHEVEGYSKIGNFDGLASATAGANNFIYCGFKPAWLMLKLYGAVGGWYIFDDKRNAYNAETLRLLANASDEEYASYTEAMDFVSNGFKLRVGGSDINRATGVLFMAFASAPFKYSNAR